MWRDACGRWFSFRDGAGLGLVVSETRDSEPLGKCRKVICEGEDGDTFALILIQHETDDTYAIRGIVCVQSPVQETTTSREPS